MTTHTEWLTYPLLTDAVLACGLGACLRLFYTVKRDVHRLRTWGQETTEALSSALKDANGGLLELRTAFAEQAAPAAAPVIPAGINVTKRSQALRMYRRGEPVASVAGALGIPRNEVELLFKVQRLVAQPAALGENLYKSLDQAMAQILDDVKSLGATSKK